MDLNTLNQAISEIENVLQLSRDATIDSVNAFESFATSVDAVRHELDPIITLTQNLIVSQRNINKTVSATSVFLFLAPSLIRTCF